ncbi:glycogen debranching N-terminal domain-containing protein [Arthrobacter sp. CJ23]|uniref:amylo-alpha-1,6-glucosidase n=1 Tax=Arthrobacter sp. CJ23 TaxID=2972479 RepID=UPI00215BFCF6|nr:glycogen debranching N-terminal domain-containing protein [Arthrobacter sp. CJ23]UVJ40030.1 amylo-alpha-1,6-glucosidase [Arthrobacter sp. CJ23]
MAGWNADTTAGPLAATVTLVDGSNFSISGLAGDMYSDRPHGVFHADTRIISRWRLTINDVTLEPLAARTMEPYRALFIGRPGRVAGHADGPLVVERNREVGTGIVEEITVRNHSREPAVCSVELAMDADFADLFEVKDARIVRIWEQTRRPDGDSLTIEGRWRGVLKRVVIQAPGATVTYEGIGYRTVVPPHGGWSTRVTVSPLLEGASIPAAFHRERSSGSPAEIRRQEWLRKIPTPQIDNVSFARTLLRSHEDIGALQIEDPERPDRTVVAAGAPWFMALFGRDSILSSYMALPLDPTLALDTLRNLADRQGTVVDLLTEEQPGRILHEVRLGVGTGLALGGQSAYYGSIDATPLFVALLGEVSRWGLAADEVAALLPHADRALDWIRDYGDRDGDGFVEYQRLNNQGLLNQGWKDSWDGINFADGRLAEPPIALCEVQGYVYSAYLSRAWMAYDAGELALASELRDSAARLKKQFNEQFWLPERGYYAIALDRDKKPVDACASNMGHCLMSGIIDADKAPQVAERLMSPEMFTGWGVRTLASDMGAYNPASYHNGSVWPHDNALIATGLMRYGFVAEAQRIALALLEAADFTDHRLPELFCGFDRSEFPEPVPYPTSCSPQAWAATTPVQLLRMLLRYDPHVSLNGLWVDPVLPESLGRVHLGNCPLGTDRITIDAKGSEATIEGLSAGMTYHRGVRPPLADLVELADKLDHSS